ncbi:MAG: methyltransferase [Bacteroidales bacterium]|nr:methyltransferase [Bacteroidales bacterium]
MSTFRFKQFSIVNDRSAMKVNTDGVLLGAAVSLRGDERRILDVGTGTGTIALEVAQRLSECGANDFAITGIDIDLPSVEEASLNFESSPWKEHLESRHIALQELEGDERFELILSNPPYFEQSLHAPDERRNAARHTEVGKSLSYKDLMEFAKLHLSENGILALILPADREADLLRYGRSCSLFARRVLRVRTVPRKDPCRIIVEFCRERTDCDEELLTIQDGGEYTEEYKKITGPFYINL